jgi:hypothetical protein
MNIDFTLEPIYYAEMDGIIQLSSLGVNNFYLKDINQLIIDKIILNGTPSQIIQNSILLSTNNGPVPVYILQRSKNAQIIKDGSKNRIFFTDNGINYLTYGFNNV